MTKPTIVLAADHAGFAHKEAVKKFLEEKGSYEIIDVGAHDLVADDDYPVYMTAAAMKVAADMIGNTKALLFGGSGQGEAMVANRFPGVRAAVWYGNAIPIGNATKEDKTSPGILKLSREHNDANILAIGARFVDEESAKKAIDAWLTTPFSGEERHKRRIDQMDNIE